MSGSSGCIDMVLMAILSLFIIKTHKVYRILPKSRCSILSVGIGWPVLCCALRH